jgi:hypothetical protein
MKPEKLLIELEQLVEKAGYAVRKERGTFQGNHCIFEGDNLVMVNKKKPIEQQVGLLARVLNNKNLQDIYIKPAVRKDLDELWQRMNRFDQAEMEISDNQHSS